MSGKALPLTRRIYLNPAPEAVPMVFEALLQAADEVDIPLAMKMNQVATALAIFKQRRVNGRQSIGSSVDGLRADNVIIAVGDRHANEMLRLVYATALEYQEVFRGRPTPLVPMRIADGLAIGDESLESGRSPAEHRAIILYRIARVTENTGRYGSTARSFYRSCLEKDLADNGVNPNNLAFSRY